MIEIIFNMTVNRMVWRSKSMQWPAWWIICWTTRFRCAVKLSMMKHRRRWLVPGPISFSMRCISATLLLFTFLTSAESLDVQLRNLLILRVIHLSFSNVHKHHHLYTGLLCEIFRYLDLQTLQKLLPPQYQRDQQCIYLLPVLVLMWDVMSFLARISPGPWWSVVNKWRYSTHLHPCRRICIEIKIVWRHGVI